MTRILIFPLLLFAAGGSVLGQGLHLKNLILTNQPNSKVVFMGIDNFFKVTSLERIEKIEARDAWIILKLDTIKVIPRKVGEINVVIQTSGGVNQFSFDSYILPELSASINSGSNSILRRDNITNQDKIELHSRKEDIGNFVGNYQVRRWEAQLNEKIFIVEGNRLPDDLRLAISKCKPGSTLIVGNIEAYNPENNRQITIPQKKFLSYSIQ